MFALLLPDGAVQNETCVMLMDIPIIANACSYAYSMCSVARVCSVRELLCSVKNRLCDVSDASGRSRFDF